MISPVSFGSTYKVKYKNPNSMESQNKKNALHEYSEDNGYQIRDSYKFITKDNFYTEVPNISKMETTVVVPDSEDNYFEAFCANRGINFKKYSTKKLMKQNAILSRVADAPKGMTKAMVDVDALFDLIQRQPNNNIEYCEGQYKKYFKEKTDLMLKSGDAIPATTLYLSSYMGQEDALEYIEKNGKDNLNTDSMIITFSKQTANPDHCMFSAMINAGLTQVPVYVSDNSLELGKALGILKD